MSRKPHDEAQPAPELQPLAPRELDGRAGEQVEPRLRPRWGLSFGLFIATCATTTLVGGWAYSVPLMTILLSHELGHYIAAKLHRVPASPPYFIPLPLPPLGTMGAVILMPDRIRSRNALLDIGAAGPLAGLVVALPVLAYGLSISPVQALPEAYVMEGRSLLYSALIHAIKGPIPEGHDVVLSATAFAGWAGLLVTMLNLIPALQLDGGHVAHALLGDRHEQISRTLRRLLLPLAVFVTVWYGLPPFAEGKRGWALYGEAQAGVPWLVWFAVLNAMSRMSPREHPPTDPGALSPMRRRVALFTLSLCVLLFMPAWLREIRP
jgi:membrane-associated protease RseP (regulator of RpoE activity)